MNLLLSIKDICYVNKKKLRDKSIVSVLYENAKIGEAH